MTGRNKLTAAICLAIACAAGFPALAKTCKPAPDPVVSLTYGSRYTDDSATRSDIDPKGDAEADEALRPIDDFLRNLTSAANKLFDEDADRTAIADCVVDQIAVWAKAGALGDLQSETANLTIGARIAGFGLILLQVLPHTSRVEEVALIKAWLSDLVRGQTRFWDNDAPEKARMGNLRAWAALGVATAADILEDPALRDWALVSVTFVLCSANADGSLPQEMRRGKFALKYQLHALAPLVVSTLLLERKGAQVQPVCDGALARAVGFAVADLDTGAATEEIAGTPQSFFDGTDELKAFHLAWLEAYLTFDNGPDRQALEDLASRYRPLSYSKLGGDQAVIWQTGK